MNCERATDAIGSPICDDSTHIMYVQARLWRADSATGEMAWGSGAQYPIDSSMDAGRIIRICLIAAKAFAEHEVGESFKYRNRRVYDPHMPIAILWEIADE